jgi:hypothetical protein
MAGLYSNPYQNLQQKNPLASTAAQAIPATRNVAGELTGMSPDKFDVQSQVNKVINSGGPLMQKAIQTGYQNANRRGLLNSSIAANSAQSAVLDVATPIATQTAAQNLDLFKTGVEDQRQRDIADLQAGSLEKQNAASAVKGISDTYMAAFQDIAKNTDLPAKTRDEYLQHIQNISNINFRLAESLYGVDIQYGGSSSVTTPVADTASKPAATPTPSKPATNQPATPAGLIFNNSTPTVSTAPATTTSRDNTTSSPKISGQALDTASKRLDQLQNRLTILRKNPNGNAKVIAETENLIATMKQQSGL